MKPATRKRDPRLDFFRGVAMLIIFIAHVPGNLWGQYIPARFGWSDAAEMFVFCSGYAAAIAFGGTFVRAGFWYGVARVAYRIWQLYSSHLIIFFFVLVLCLLGNALLDSPVNYLSRLNLHYTINHPVDALIGLFTLTYVPNYFDILPMYMGALLLVPCAMLLSRVHPWAPLTAAFLLYAANWILDGGLPAHPAHPHLEWFFNPLGWQILFFTGFALARGWIKAPPPHAGLVCAALLFVVISIPFAHWPTWTRIPAYDAIHDVLKPWRNKTDYGLLRYVHFMCLAYLAIVFVRGREHLLELRWARPVLAVGQQALPVFLLNLWLAQLAGMALDMFGRTTGIFALVNLAGLACIVGFAYVVRWIKRSPWQTAQGRRPETGETRVPADRLRGPPRELPSQAD